MQCAAVLLLELCYQNQHTKDNNAEITSDVQKLIGWLHALSQNDPCADRAYAVLQRILHDVAPYLRPKATELLKTGTADDIQTEKYHNSFIYPHAKQSTDSNWVQGNLFDGSEESSGHMCYAQPGYQNYHDTMFPPNGWPTQDTTSFDDMRMPNMLGNPFINNWDESIPLNGLHNLWWPNSRSFTSSDPVSTRDMYLNPNLDGQEQQQQ